MTASLINDLKAQVHSGDLVIIAGVGVSITACANQSVDGHSVSCWDGLLRHGVDCCRNVHGLIDDDDAKLLEMQISNGKPDFLIAAAEMITEKLRGKSLGVFKRWLKDSVGQLQATQPEILQALADLSGVLATLNYDGLIEQATGRRVCTWRQSDKVEEILRGENAESVLHLHGYYDEPDSVVLGLRSYISVSENPHTQAVLRLFALDRTMLFVGCGGTLQDPNFSRLLDWGSEALKHSTHRHFLLCREDDLTQMREAVKSAPWLHPLPYGKHFAELAPFLRGLSPVPGSAPLPLPPRPPSLDIDGYIKAMNKRYRRLKLEELDPTTHDIKPLTLVGLFIPQNVRECVEFMPRVFELPKEIQKRLRSAGELSHAELDAEMLEQNRRAYLDRSTRASLEIVAAPDLRRLVILGDPGSGKSSLLQYVLLQALDNFNASKPLPILVELREYARARYEQSANDFFEFLEKAYRLPKAPLQKWLSERETVFLFDGLDEIFDKDLRKQIAETIQIFAEDYPLTRIAATSRIIGYRHEIWRDAGFRHFMLQDLEDEQIEDFLTRWHREAYADRQDGDSKRDRLARAIADSHAIRELAGNPLLLTMMAILNRTQDLPRDRAELYEQCARLLLHQWKTDDALKADPVLRNATLDYKDKRGLMLRIARAMQTSPKGLAGNFIGEDELEQSLKQELAAMSIPRPDRAARALIEQLRGRNFMLSDLGGHAYAFVHRSLLEYFCAADLRQRFESEQSLTLDQLLNEVYGEHWQDETWHEVLSLLAGLISPRHVAEIIRFLLNQDDPGQTCLNVFLAARCMADVRVRRELGEVVERELKIRLGRLVRFELNWYDEYEEIDRVPDIRHKSVIMLAGLWRDQEEMRKWLEMLVDSNEELVLRQAALMALAREWKHHPKTIDIIDKEINTENNIISGLAITLLAMGWRDRPETLSVVKQCLNNHPSEWTRLDALRILCKNWPHESELYALLKECAQSDLSQFVRSTAVQILAERWNAEMHTLQLMLDIASNSKEKYWVRRSAIYNLSKFWQENDRVYNFLKNYAISNDENNARCDAINCLVAQWPDHPDTLPLLRNAAQDDQDEYCRLTAIREIARICKDKPDILPWLKRISEQDNSVLARQTALGELASGWKYRAEILPFLKERYLIDSAVQWTIVSEVANRWRDDPETFSWLLDCAYTGSNIYGRRQALQELAKGWPEYPETLATLQNRAQHDTVAEVRAAAVHALARIGKHHADTLPILQKRANSDRAPSVREAALRQLARGWRDAPETSGLLQKRSKQDTSKTVREAAKKEYDKLASPKQDFF